MSQDRYLKLNSEQCLTLSIGIGLSSTDHAEGRVAHVSVRTKELNAVQDVEVVHLERGPRMLTKAKVLRDVGILVAHKRISQFWECCGSIA